MRFANVMIRDKDAVDILDGRIRAAFNTAIHNKVEVPIYYQYGQAATPKLVEEKEYYMGKASNIRWNEYDQLVCDVTINMSLPVADNYTGIIDNFIIPVIKDDQGNMLPMLSQFIIYDKQFKKAVDEQRKNYSRVVKTMPSPMDGGMPIETHDESLPEILGRGGGFIDPSTVELPDEVKEMRETLSKNADDSLPDDVKQKLEKAAWKELPDELKQMIDESVENVANQLKEESSNANNE